MSQSYSITPYNRKDAVRAALTEGLSLWRRDDLTSTVYGSAGHFAQFADGSRQPIAPEVYDAIDWINEQWLAQDEGYIQWLAQDEQRLIATLEEQYGVLPTRSIEEAFGVGGPR